MRELRDITEAVRGVFELDGYGEVWTPTLEYEEVLARGGAAPPAYRVFDDHGEVLALRTDMTVPIARLVATRYPTAEPPLRFCYFAHAYRGVRPHRGQMREFLQAGIELVGSPAPDGTAEALTVMCHALTATGLRGYSIGLGDASLYRMLLRSFEIADEVCDRLVGTLARRDFVALEAELAQLDIDDADAEVLLRVPQLRGGPDLLSDAEGAVAEAVAGLRRVYERLAPEVAERVIFDLGLTRDLGYYTGAVFEVYDPALGAPLGGGGRYDDLIGRFGRPLPAVGFALGIDRLHIALTGEERAAMS
ncbi:MAG: ATP phosphoribosyltransferase regulatory subunit [Solirubrobacterales bacterium]|nr:ATP phosphoribosyltransferase regulatory subunit [Solirubrobacterales bacterium]